MMAELEELENRLNRHVETQDKLLESRLKLWIASAVIMQVVPLITIAFFIGGIYQNMSSSIALLSQQQNELNARGKWMEDRQRWELAVEIWGAQMNPPLRVPRPAGSFNNQQGEKALDVSDQN